MDELEMYLRSLTVVFGLACAGGLVLSLPVFLVVWAACKVSGWISKAEEK